MDINTEIIKYEQSEEEFYKNDELFRSFSENSLDIHGIFKPVYNDKKEIVDFICMYQNTATHTIGKSSKDIIGVPLSKAYPKILKSKTFKKAVEVVETGQSLEFEVEYICEGKSSWFHIVATPVPVGVALSVQIITKQKEAEKSLQERKTKYRILFETSNDGFWWTDKYGYVTEINDGTAQMLGYSQEEIIGKVWLDFVVDELKEEEYKEWEKQKSVKASSHSIKLKKKDGSVIWVFASTSPITDEDGNNIGNLVTFKNITELKVAKEKLIKGEKKALALVAELEEADRNKNEFLSMLSHELRNPLAAIKGGIKILELKNTDEESQKIITILNRQAGHLSKLVNDLLDVTRITENKLIINKEIVNLNEIVRNAIVDHEPQFINKNIKLLDNICTQEIVVDIDPLRIIQCIENLLGNALKFTNENGNVRVFLTIDKGYGVINIQDDGIGISPKLLPKIFEPFKQELDHVKSHNNRGLGLGLSLVKEIIEMHGGDVSVNSFGLGKGALFAMRIPIVKNL